MSEPIFQTFAKTVRQMARAEVERYAGLVNEELARTPPRADGNWNARDQFAALEDAKRRYAAGEQAGS